MAEEIKDGQTDPNSQTDPNNETDPKEHGDNLDGKDDNQKPEGEGKTLTEEEVNQIVQKRVNATKEKYKDYDDLKTKLEKYEQAEAERKRSEQTELENAQTDLGAKDEELTQARQELENIKQQIETDKINRAFEKHAREAGIEYVEDAQSLADMSKVKVTDDGVQGIEDVIKGLVDTKPYLVKQAEGQRKIGERNNGGESNRKDPSTEELLKAAAEKARKSGRLDDKIAYVNLKAELTQ